MSKQAKRIGLLSVALVVMAFSLVACQLPASTGGSSNTTSNGAILLPTMDTTNVSPTPAYPPFTVGAWPSNFSPNNNDTVVIYVICRVQDPSMQGPSKPPPTPLQVNIFVGGGIGQGYSGTTGKDGIAAIPVTFNVTQAGQPIVVNVTVSYNGKTYKAQTFFTPSPNAKSTPTPKSGGPTSTPTIVVPPAP